MNEKLKILLTRKQEIAVEINKLACVQRELTKQIQILERAENKEDLLGKEGTHGR